MYWSGISLIVASQDSPTVTTNKSMKAIPVSHCSEWLRKHVIFLIQIWWGIWAVLHVYVYLSPTFLSSDTNDDKD